MGDLLDFVTVAHGGLARWSSSQTVSAKADIYGPTWARKGQGDLLGMCEVSASINRQYLTLDSEQSGHTIVFDGALDRVTVSSSAGRIVERLDQPRRSLLRTDPAGPWTAAQVGYFVGYGMWGYLLEPYLFHLPGVHTREIEPWHERGETWRRLEVTFPESLATHETTIIYHFDSRTGLQRRMDYAPEVFGGRRGAHYTFEHRTWDGMPVPSQRRILIRDSAGHADHHSALILLDIHSFQFTSAEHQSPTSAPSA
jgi:hypothetical protein